MTVWRAMEIPEARAERGGFAAAMLSWIGGVARGGFAGMVNARGARRMAVVERLELGDRRQLLLVECEGRRYLVGAGGQGVQAIAEVGEQVEAELGCGS